MSSDRRPLQLIHPPPTAEQRQVAPSQIIGTGIFILTEVMFFAGLISAFAVGIVLIPPLAYLLLRTRREPRPTTTLRRLTDGRALFEWTLAAIGVALIVAHAPGAGMLVLTIAGLRLSRPFVRAELERGFRTVENVGEGTGRHEVVGGHPGAACKFDRRLATRFGFGGGGRGFGSDCGFAGDRRLGRRRIV